MIVYIVTIITLFLCIIVYKKYNEIMSYEMECAFSILVLCFVIAFVAEITLILVKPINYRDFKIEYDTVKQITTSFEDIRDTNYTMKLIEINQKINLHRAYIDSKWIGIFFNKKIAELELLEK